MMVNNRPDPVQPMTPKPQQPEDHESKCACYDCEEWAYALLDWEEAEKQAGRNPWADTSIRTGVEGQT